VGFSDNPTIIYFADLLVSLPYDKVESFASILTNWSKHFDFTLEKHENGEYSNLVNSSNNAQNSPDQHV